ncbi:hypothetical protein [Streptomyces sp. AC154]|uniref:hypothetical protein n=1 Tax=Streptomyces sp. AC154 TaxID=3143184 RepID=UPI003F7D40B7
MYRDREWRQRGVALEFAFAGQLGRTAGLTESVRDAVRRMHGELAGRHGEAAALRAFSAPDAVAGNPAAELERLLALPPGPLAVDELMSALTYASYAGPGLPREVAEALSRPAGRRARFAPGSAYRAVHDSRGLRRVGGDRGPALRLLRTYAALGASPEQLLAFRDAVIAWAVPADLQSLPEILSASHRLGLGTDEERELALRDGAGLHNWAADTVATSDAPRSGPDTPPAEPLVPPHRALYAERMTFGQDITRSRLALPDGLVALTAAALAGDPLPDTDRGRALGTWLNRYGDEGRKALERLHPAHLTAVHLYSGADYRQMKAFLNGERFGPGMGRRLVRLNTWTMTRKMAEVGAADLLPMTLRKQPGFAALFDAMWDVDDLQDPTPEVAGLRRRLDAMADALYEDLPLHVDMAIEALELLPPLNRDVWWGDRGMPGPLGEPPADGPVYGTDGITMPFFRSTALVREEALGFMNRSKGVPGDAHRGLVHVAGSTAREVSPFVALPLETEALYPPGASFDVSARTVVPGDLLNEPYESVEATEVTARHRMPGAARRIAEAGPADELFGIGPSAGAAETGERPAPVLRPIHGQDGELIGVASFDDADWAVRQEQYARLGGARGFVSWERDGEDRPVAAERTLPGGGTAEGTFFFASHGGHEGLALVTEDGEVLRDDGTYAGRLLRSARRRGARSVTVLACGPGDVPRSEAEARARAKRMADGSGLPVHLPVGRAAVSEGLPHLLEDAEGRVTQWVTEYPDGWSGPRTPAPGTGSRTSFGRPAREQFNVTGSTPDTAPEPPAEAPWAVSSWQPAGAPETARFTGLYREREWRQAAVDWEDSLAEALSEAPELAEAVGDVVRELYAALAEQHGEEAAQRAFFAPDQAPQDPAAELEQLLGTPAGPEALDGLMRVLLRAAYAGRELPRQVEEALAGAGGGFGRFMSESAYRAVFDSRGLRRVGGERGPALRLLRMAAALDLPPTVLPAFRAALAAWMIPGDLQSLHEVLRASHLIGMGAADERAAATRDGASLHTWAVGHFLGSGLLPAGPDSGALDALAPPHQVMYQQRMSFPFEVTGTMDVPDALVAMADAALDDTLPPRPTGRLLAMSGWLDRHGERGVEALRRLTPAHLTALYLYSSYDYRLMKALLNGERLGQGVSRHLVRFHTWRYILDSAREEELDMPPLTLVSQPEFTELYEALSELPDLDAPSPELARLRRRVDMMADRLHGELKLHIDMAIEALDILPPVGRTAWWGERGAPGPVDAPDVNGPMYGEETIDVAFFRSASLVVGEAVEFALGDKSVPSGSHRKLIEIRDSTARDGVPFFKHLSEGEALYPPGMRFDVVGRRLVHTEKRPPMLSEVVEEATPLPDSLAAMPQDGPLPFTPAEFADPAGELFGLATGQPSAEDAPAPRGYRRTGPDSAEFGGTVFALHESPGEGDRTVDTLLFALRYVATDALRAADVGTAGEFRDWLDRTLTADDVTEGAVPPLDGGRSLPLGLLDRIGVALPAGQRAEAMLLGDRFPAARISPDPVQRLRALLSDPSYGGEGVDVPVGPLVTAAARGLGVAVAVAGPDGTTTLHGEPTASTPAALLVRDGDRLLAGLPDGPDATTTATGSEARLRRLADALTGAPLPVRNLLAARPAPEWVLSRIRYAREAARFEQRLGRYLGGHEAANAQLGAVVRELWERAAAVGRWPELGSDDPTVDGAVGTGRERLQAVVESGNLRERMAMLWIGAQSPDGHGGLISDLLGSAEPNPEVITAEYRASRPQSEAMTAYTALSGRPDRTPGEQALLDEAERTLRTPVRPEDLSPPLSGAERALMGQAAVPWIPGTNRFHIAMSTPVQSDAEADGSLVLAGTSGSAHRLMSQAAKMREAWGLDVDLGLVRLGVLAEMLQAEHHSLDEIMRGSQLVLDRLRRSGSAEPAELDYTDNWGRYWRIAPLTEAELREHVATDGRFPDEHALETTAGPAGTTLDLPDDPVLTEWLVHHQNALEDVLHVLEALSPDILSGPDDGVLTDDRLEQLIDAWLRARGLDTSGSLAGKLRRILDDRA